MARRRRNEAASTAGAAKAAPAPQPPPAPRRRAAVAWVAVPLVLAAAAYARALSGPLEFDDRANIVDNPYVKDLGGMLGRRLLEAALSGGRVLTDLTFAANYALGGLEPWNYHLTNLAIHLAAVALVFAFTARVAWLAGAERPLGLALAVAGLFALHPIQTEAVTYVVQRAESLASAFYVAVLLLLLSAERRAGTWRGRAAWAGALVAYGAGLLAKAIVVTAPVAHLLVAAAVAGTPAARRELVPWRRRLVLVAPLLALGAVFAASTLLSLRGRPDAGFSVPGAPASTYLATQFPVLLTYLRLLVWPAGQNVDWSYPFVRGPLDPRAWVSALAVALLVAGAAALWIRGRRVEGPGGAAARLAALGAGWFLVVLSPTSSVVPLADALVEHRLYLASWGPFLALAAGAERALARLGARAAAAAVAGVWLALAAATYRRNAVWESSEALWSDALAKTPRNARAALGLGRALGVEGRFEESIAVSRRGLEHVRDPVIESKLLNNIAIANTYAGRPDDAIFAYRLALERTPGDLNLLGNLSGTLLAKGDLAGAEETARRALRVSPTDPNALNNLAAVRLQRGEAVGALELLNRALAVDPDRGVLWFNRGRAYGILDRRAEACRDWVEAGRHPLAPETRKDLQRLLGHCGRPGPPR